ncbi:ArsR/SmtB family transcription factor [Pseudooceanicola sp. C21-150M6]|uniref:ArsR/SmtB family transcription factor n=1 Tax=Pseudooceanicola sp. C21-150M6 TaxID=3434355 RepID=UPI003D7F3598
MNRLSTIFSALSDATRLSLVEKLLSQGELPAGALAESTEISAPAVSRHLKVLRTAGVIEQRIQGTHRYYSVRPDALQQVHRWTMDHSQFWQQSLDRFDQLLALDPEGDDI